MDVAVTQQLLLVLAQASWWLHLGAGGLRRTPGNSAGVGAQLDVGAIPWGGLPEDFTDEKT